MSIIVPFIFIMVENWKLLMQNWWFVSAVLNGSLSVATDFGLLCESVVPLVGCEGTARRLLEVI